jgi:hypothetical protein
MRMTPVLRQEWIMIMMIVTAPMRLLMMINNETVGNKANDDLNAEMDAKYGPST